MSGKKLSPEEELEKQYREYKAQFEEWRIKNKGSEGTEGYIQYVQKFERWEKDVEARRKAVKAKAEHERNQKAATQGDYPQNEQDAAVRYAEQQKSYMAMHQRAMLEEEMQRQQQRQVQEVPQHQQHNIETHESPVKHSTHIIQAEAQPAQQVEQQQERPPLWGPDGADFSHNDIMFGRWNFRAAPPNSKIVYQPPPNDAPIVPSWYLSKKMEDQGMFYGYNVNLACTPEITLEGMPEFPPQMKIEGQNGNSHHANFSEPPPNFSQPPPSFNSTISSSRSMVERPPSDFSVPPPSLVHS